MFMLVAESYVKEHIVSLDLSGDYENFFELKGLKQGFRR